MSQCLTPQQASGCGVSPTRQARAALLAGCLLLFARESFAAVVRIEEIRTTVSGEVALSFRASLDHYYILERCESLADPMRPTRLVLPILETNTLTDSLAGTSAFYRLRTVPLSDPLDTDGDGLDDAYELRRGPALNPLAPGDASQRTSNGPLTPWQEYRLAWFIAGTKRIAAGDHHVLALAEDGTLWGCGENRSGQLGSGTTNSVVDLISLQPANRWRAVGAGGSQSFAIREDGTLWAWGKGALGDGSTTNHLVPIQVAQDTNWACFVASQNHVAGLKQDQSLWAWGDNAAGQLGDGSTEPRAAPVSIGPGIKWKEVAVGQNLTVALSEEGKLYACGHNSYGQLGTGATNLNSNVLVPVAGGYRWRSMAAGDFHVVAIRDDGTLWSWGQLYEDAGNGFGTMTNRFTPVQVGTATNWLTVVGGFQHSLALDTQCNAWSWGYNAFGELGQGTQLPQISPTSIASGTSWIAVRASGLNHIGIRADGTLWNWSGGSGQYAGDTSGFRAVMPERRFRAVAAGDNHSAAVEQGGAVWTWGANESRQLGDGTLDSGLPRLMASNIVGRVVTTGGRHTLVLDESKQLWMAGAVFMGQSWWATQWPTLWGTASGTNEYKVIASGSSHWLTLDTSGAIQGFGGADNQVPVAGFPNSTPYTAIGAGGLSSLAVSESGSVWIWGKLDPRGSAYFGEVSTPGFRFQSVIGGAQHVLALRVDGTLWSTGNNTWGQLGIGTNSYPGIFKPVLTNVTWKTASAYYHNLAISIDGSLWFWGYDGNRSITRSPIPISTNQVWKAVAAGYNHSLALREDGTLWAWGKNQFGQLGISPFRQIGTASSWKPPRPQ